MAVKIYEDQKSGETIVWTSCLTAGDFLVDLSAAMAEATKAAGDTDIRIHSVLSRAMPIAFKLSGYKADDVNEARTLTCGIVSPDGCTVIGRGGRE